MNISRDDLLKLPLTWNENYTLLLPIFDYSKATIVALKIKGKTFISRPSFISLSEIKYRDDKLEVLNDTTPLDRKKYSNITKYGDIVQRGVYAGEKQFIGSVTTYKLDLETGALKTLWVKTPIHLRGLWRDVLIIDQSQIIKIGPDKIFVDDLIAKSAMKTPETRNIIQENDGLLPDAGY